MKLIDESLGWYGTAAVLLAYALVSLNFVIAESLSYQILNATGAFGLMFISLKKKVYQPAVLYIIWTIIALISIVKIVF